VDDAFISLRYAANWLGGEGLVFNPGERVEGVTNIGWVWLVGGVGALVPVPLPALAKGLGLLCLLAAVVLVSLAHRRVARPVVPGTSGEVPGTSGVESFLLPVLVVSSPELVYFSLAGMETGLAALLLAMGLWFSTWSGERARVGLLAAGVAVGVLFAVRPEAVVLFPLFVGGSWALGRRRGVLGAFGAFAGVVLAVTAFRLGYYGAWLPNTFVAKSSGPVGEIAGRAWAAFVGRHVNLPAPWVGSMLSLLGGAGVWVLWRSSSEMARRAALFLAAGVVTGAAFSVYAPADWTEMGRYFGPYVPFASLLAVRGLFGGVRGWMAARSGRARAGHLASGSVVLLLAGVGLWRDRVHLGAEALGEYPGFVLASETLIGPARWAGAYLPPGTTIAARRIGALGYFGGVPVLDYAFGLTDPEVARLRRAEGSSPFESPDDKALARVWARRPPGCVLEDDDVMARLAVSPGSPWRTVHGVRYLEVRRFPLGDGSTEWVLACRPTVIRLEASRRAADGSTPEAARSRRRRAPPPP
jgi:arabinofuranosyltransferase